MHHKQIYNWSLVFQECEFEVIVWPGHTKIILDHLLIIQTSEALSGIDNDLPNAHLFKVEVVLEELDDIIQFVITCKAPEGLIEKKKDILAMKSIPYTLINGSLYNIGQDDILHWCVLEHERQEILEEDHSGTTSGHYQVEYTIKISFKFIYGGLL